MWGQFGVRARAVPARAFAAGGALICATVLAGCAAPVSVEPPTEAPEQCDALVGALPARLAGQDERTTEPDSLATAAWGDPPISVRCGIGTPAAYEPTSRLLTVNGVDWLAEELSSGVRFSSIGEPVNIEVTVPSAYAPEANVIAEVSRSLARATPPDPAPS